MSTPFGECKACGRTFRLIGVNGQMVVGRHWSTDDGALCDSEYQPPVRQMDEKAIALRATEWVALARGLSLEEFVVRVEITALAASWQLMGPFRDRPAVTVHTEAEGDQLIMSWWTETYVTSHRN